MRSRRCGPLLAVIVVTLLTGCVPPGDVRPSTEVTPATPTSAVTSPSLPVRTSPPPWSEPSAEPSASPTTVPTTVATTTPPNVEPPAPTPPDQTAWDRVPQGLRGVDVERVPTTEQVVALTFDAGSSDAGVQSILATLAETGVPATFFITGDFARRYPDAVASIAAAGHRLGNHSDHHDHYPALINAQIAADLEAAEAAIVSASGGVSPIPLFRFPYGDRTDADIRAVNAAGYLPVRWTVDTLGWAGTERDISADVVVQRVLDRLTPGEIVLAHVGANPDDGSTFDADALPRLISELQARGYRFVTLDALVSG